jgi:hypothetical protein
MNQSGSVFCKNKCDEVQSFADKYRLKTRLDEDGTKIIPGKRGHVYQYDGGLLGVMVMPDLAHSHYWGHVRTRLSQAGFIVVQDADSEGAATFDPKDAKQAELAIRAAGVKRKRQISPERTERQIARLRASAGRPLCPLGKRPSLRPYVSTVPYELERIDAGNSSCGSIGHLPLDHPQRFLRPPTHQGNKGAK